ncbi:MAG: RNA methyltransferase [Bradymonadaceae bacterium]
MPESLERSLPEGGLPEALDRVTVVLHEPQDDINIGNAVRASKNFGVTSLRLVRPASADPEQIAVSAPKADDVIGGIETYDSLDAALGDCVRVVATTARPREAEWTVTEPRGAAVSAIEAVEQGRVAYVFGREDYGLPNEALDRAHSVVTIPTNPDYPSLNLGQAVLLNVWECFRVACDLPIERPDIEWVDAESSHPAPEMETFERLFDDAEEALHAVDFFQVDETWNIMRTLRDVFLRAGLDRRELNIFLGIFNEVTRTVERLRDDDE